MDRFMTTRLWQASLAPQPADSPDGARARLAGIFLKFRERAAMVAGEIARDLPEFTVHDVTHLDALWEMASLIAGDRLHLTPTEAFVLGGAFLTHDLGMGLAAFPEGRVGLYKDPNWNDLVMSALKKRLGRTPSLDEQRSKWKEVEIETITELLRQRHAKQAEQLSLVSWRSNDGKTLYHLIEDPELRDAFGTVIGEIAYSHWWSIDEVRERFGDLPLLHPPAGIECPSDWTIDRLKLACLLRTSDAIHLDCRRAPGFLRALRKPSGYADLHWTFQQHINTPGMDGERVTFTAGYAFPVEEAPAWWVGYDLLKTADRELRQVDTLLQDLDRKYRFELRAVAGVESPLRLVRHVPTQNWVPIDARVQVSNVAALVQSLGGEQLYGSDNMVPLRELIQNASDAVRARRLLKNLPDGWGNVIVRLGKDDTGEWIEVEDQGIGMSTAVLTGPFLDFGNSFWDTAMMREEWPRLQATGFQSSGKYGIGFFSVFMWGNRIRVTTRRLGNAERDTQVLEFSTGLESRPILRKATESEFIEEGTRVRVWLKDASRGLLSVNWRRGGEWTLNDLCAWLCPCVDVNVYVQESGGALELSVASGDWKSMNGVQLIRRIFLDSSLEDKRRPETAERLLNTAKNLRSLNDSSGNAIGRAAVSVSVFNYRERSGVITTVGGLRNGEMGYIAGVLIGTSTRAARDLAVPIVENQELARWASEQSRLVVNTYAETHEQVRCADTIRQCGGNTGDLPIAASAKGWLSAPEISDSRDLPGEVLLIEKPYYIDEIVLNDNVFAVPGGNSWFLGSASYRSEIKWPEFGVIYSNTGHPIEYNTLKAAVIEALAKAWGSSLNKVVESSCFSIGETGQKFAVGTKGIDLLLLAADVIRKPTS